MAALLPTLGQLAQLQTDCERLLPTLFASCRVLQLREGALQVAVPNAALATRLKQVLPKLQEGLRQKGWPVDAVKLKVQLMPAVPQSPQRQQRHKALSNQAVGAFALSEYQYLEAGLRKLLFNPLERTYSQFVPEVLLLQATIDPATPRQFSEAVVSDLQQAGVRPQVYTMAHASHSTLRTSTVVDARSGMTCGLLRMLHFLGRRSPEGFACQEALTDWDFATPASQAFARELIGRPDPWRAPDVQAVGKAPGVAG